MGAKGLRYLPRQLMQPSPVTPTVRGPWSEWAGPSVPSGHTAGAAEGRYPEGRGMSGRLQDREVSMHCYSLGA